MDETRSKWFTRQDIYRQVNQLYLVRYIFCKLKWFSAFLHCFHLSDYDTPHDHPAAWLSIPLTCGYIEHLIDGTTEERKPFRPKFRTAREFHWVELHPGTEGKVWTLFFFFNRVREWGFMTKLGWVHHDDYENILKQDAAALQRWEEENEN